MQYRIQTVGAASFNFCLTFRVHLIVCGTLPTRIYSTGDKVAQIVHGNTTIRSIQKSTYWFLKASDCRGGDHFELNTALLVAAQINFCDTILEIWTHHTARMTLLACVS